MKRFFSVFLVIVSASAMLSAESVLNGLFGAANQITSDVPRIVAGDRDLLIGGVSFNRQQVQLGDLLADLIANRLASVERFSPGIIKQYNSLQYPPAQASWVLSGTLYEAGAGYLLTVQLIDNISGSQIKGWEFALGAEGIDTLLQPSVLNSTSGAWDLYEPNNTVDEAVIVEPPFSAEGLSLTDGDEDWFAFDVPESGGDTVLLLNASTGGNMDTYMELYAPDGGGMTFAENDDSDDANAAIQVPLNQPGLWLIKVRAFSPEDEGEYRLDISLEEIIPGPGEPDEGMDLATSLNVGSTPLEKRIDYSEDKDWFRIDLLRPLGMEEVLRVETMSQMDLIMEMVDENGNYIMDDDDSGQDNNPMIIASGLDEGSYYITVYGYGGEIGPYEIMANIMLPVKDEFEDDNSMISASGISADGRVQRRNFTPMDDTDWVQFDVESEGRYLIKTRGDLDTYMELYDGDGNMLEENDDGEDYNAVIERYLSPGRYYLHIYPYGTAGPEDIYELSVEPVQ